MIAGPESSHPLKTAAIESAQNRRAVSVEWPYLENRVRVRSRSSEMAPIDRAHTRLNT